MDDLRATIEGAMNNASQSTQEASPEPVVAESSGPDEVAAPDAQGQGADGTDGVAPGVAPRSDGPLRARDATGKFAPKGKAITKQGGEVAAPASTGGEPPISAVAAPAPAAAETAIRPPSSLTPSEREHFAKAPPEVQKAFTRLDSEVRKTMQEAAPARRLQQEFNQAVAPFEGMLRQSGFQNPLQAMQNTFATVQQLQQGSPDQVAALLSNLVQTYGTKRFGAGFIEQLAAGIDGAPQAQQRPMHVDPDAIARQAEERVFQRLDQQRQEAGTAKARAQVEQFAADPANEFFEDVWADMAGILDAARSRGVEMSMKDAYTRACRADPDTWAIVQQRENAKRQETAQAATRRSVAAGSSVRNQPASPVNGTRAAGNLRADIEAAFAKVGGR